MSTTDAKDTQELKRSNAELEQFAYIASHDMKAPLRSISNLATWIEEDLAAVMTPDTKEKFDLLHSRLRRLEALLNDILSYSRAGHIVTPPVDVDTGKMLRAIAVFLATDKFSVNIGDGMPVLNAARTPLEQVFTNLIVNAIKHHDRDTGSVEVRVADKDAFYEFSVQDDGPGIPPEFHERVFQMFQTLKPRDVTEGSGLGMSLVKKLVEWQGGKVWIVSEKGRRGTDIRFTWPKAAV